MMLVTFLLLRHYYYYCFFYVTTLSPLPYPLPLPPLYYDIMIVSCVTLLLCKSYHIILSLYYDVTMFCYYTH